MIAAIKAWLNKPDWDRSVADGVFVGWAHQVAIIVVFGVRLAPTIAFIALCVWMITGGK